MRSTADRLANLAGGIVGGAVGTQVAMRTGNPTHIVAGRAAGAGLAPRLIEDAALGLYSKVTGRKKRRQSNGQKKRSRAMSKSMKRASSRARLKSGDFRKGWNQKRLMQLAHKYCNKEMR